MALHGAGEAGGGSGADGDAHVSKYRHWEKKAKDEILMSKEALELEMMLL
jgi:hypothetical protein